MQYGTYPKSACVPLCVLKIYVLGVILQLIKPLLPFFEFAVLAASHTGTTPFVNKIIASILDDNRATAVYLVVYSLAISSKLYCITKAQVASVHEYS